MVAYEFYLRNGKGRELLMGILPERRKNLERINQESIMKWGRMVLRDHSSVDFSKYYCIPLKINPYVLFIVGLSWFSMWISQFRG